MAHPASPQYDDKAVGDPSVLLCDQFGETPESLSLKDDLRRLLPGLRDDARGLVNCNNTILLAAAVGGAVAIRDGWDDDVRERTARGDERWTDAGEPLGWMGDAVIQVPVLLAVYGYSLRQQDAELHDLSVTLIRAYTLTGLSTTIIKGVANTERPDLDWNDGQFGFPSFHAASSMAVAGVLDEYYGCRIGVPAMLLAALIGWSRVEERDHDLSDVVFGSALGYIIGKSVAGNHLRGDGRVRLLPWTSTGGGGPGLACEVAW